MKAARIVVLVVAVGAGGIAALLMAGRSDLPAPIARAPVTQIDIIDILVAKNDLGIGQTLGPQDAAWQAMALGIGQLGIHQEV